MCGIFRPNLFVTKFRDRDLIMVITRSRDQISQNILIMKFVLFLILVATSCICDSDLINLDIDIRGRRPKILTIKGDYQGVPYYVFLAQPGYEIKYVSIGDRPVFRGTRYSRKIQTVIVHYNKSDGDVPIFIVKTEKSEVDSVIVTERTQAENDLADAIVYLMKCVRQIRGDDPYIQQQLKYLDRTSFRPNTTCRLIYDVFYGENHVEGLPDEIGPNEDE